MSDTHTVVFDRMLSDDELAAIRAAIDNSDRLPAIEACVAFYRLAAKSLGHDDIDAMAEALGGTFAASQFAIPDVQWADICEHVMDRENGLPLAAVNGALDWMNRGPSGRETMRLVRDVDCPECEWPETWALTYRDEPGALLFGCSKCSWRDRGES